MGKKSRKPKPTALVQPVGEEAELWRGRIQGIIRNGDMANDAALHLVKALRSSNPPQSSYCLPLLDSVFAVLLRRHEEWKALVCDVRGFDHNWFHVDDIDLRISSMLLAKAKQVFHEREFMEVAQLFAVTNDCLETRMKDLTEHVDLFVESPTLDIGFCAIVRVFNQVSTFLDLEQNALYPFMLSHLHMFKYHDNDTSFDVARAEALAEMFRARGRDYVEAKMRRRRCVVCNSFRSISEPAFLVCARCCDGDRDRGGHRHRVHYCSEACQKADWDAGHKLICK